MTATEIVNLSFDIGYSSMLCFSSTHTSFKCLYWNEHAKSVEFHIQHRKNVRCVAHVGKFGKNWLAILIVVHENEFITIIHYRNSTWNAKLSNVRKWLAENEIWLKQMKRKRFSLWWAFVRGPIWYWLMIYVMEKVFRPLQWTTNCTFIRRRNETKKKNA